MTTRRDIITSGLGLAAIIAAGKAPAALVRSMAAARQTMQNGKLYDAEVQFIQSNGTGYVFTLDFYLQSGYKFVCEFMPTVTSQRNHFIGKWLSSGLGFCVQNYDGIYWPRYAQSTGITGAGNAKIERQKITLGSGIYRLESATQNISKTLSTSAFTSTIKANLFSEGNTIESYYKFYCVKVYQSDLLFRDLIPVRVGSVGYMYDRVSGKLFGNAGTGAFIVGPDK